MSSPGQRLADAALAFLGTPFRLHGRSQETGLDCVGLVHVSLMAIGRASEPPEGYRLRNLDAERWYRFAEASGMARTSGKPVPGDILLISPGPSQQHLVIVENASHAIHAHAGLGRVVSQPMQFPTVPIAHWRLI